MNKVFNLKTIKIWEILIAILGTSYCFGYGWDINGYKNLFLIPLAYLILCICSRKMYNTKSFAVNCLHIIAFIKYFLTPVIIVFNKDYYDGVLTGGRPENSEVERAIYFIIYEMVIVFAFLEFYDIFSKGLNLSQYRNKNTKFNIAFGAIFVLGIIFLALFKNYLLPKILRRDSEKRLILVLKVL